MMDIRRVAAGLTLAILAGCAQVEKKPEPVAEPLPDNVAEPQEQRIESQPLKYLVGRNFKPQPTRPLNVKSKCSHRDAVGTQTHLNLLVKDAQVKTFTAQVTIPHRGVCRFDLKNFEQTATLPQALLKAKEKVGHGGWEGLFGGSNVMSKDGKNLTFAFTRQHAARYMKVASYPTLARQALLEDQGERD